MQNFSESEISLNWHQKELSEFTDLLSRLTTQKQVLENELSNAELSRKKIIDAILIKENEANNQSETKNTPLKFFSNAIQGTKNVYETTILQSNLKSIDAEIQKIHEKLDRNFQEIQQCNIQIDETKKKISYILSQREQGNELYDNQWSTD